MSLTLAALIGEKKDQLNTLEKRIGHHFKDQSLLMRALIHSSFAFEKGEIGTDNETLEFLGDAVLDLVVGALLIQRYPQLKEGELTRLRAALVNEGGLAGLAREITLGEYICLGKGENATRGREKPSILSGTYEAMIGAIFLDAGYNATAELVEKNFAPQIKGRREILLAIDAKSSLQERVQERFNEAPTYSVEKEEGPAHNRMFTVAVRFRENILAHGCASNKKEAEQQAAAAALGNLEQILSPDAE